MTYSSNNIIKGYELLDKLGAGGFGAVYRAHQTLLKRDVAIKVILPEHANKPDFVRRFEIEAELVARLEHPHIVPIYDFWRDPDGAYIIMRYIKGVNLAQKLTNTTLSELETARLLDQISVALHFAHRNMVVHRDLKPENILIDEDGNAYLLDFGIAKDLSRTQDPNSQGGGTLMYTSPEQLTGEPITPQTDLYSLGLLVYEILTGNLPYERTTPHAIKQLQSHKDLPAVSTISDEMLNILRHATHPQPQERFESAIEFMGAFRDALNIRPSSVSISTLSVDPIDDEFVELTNPYKGLLAFQEYDSHNFFGRDMLVDRLIKRLTDDDPKRFMAVVGPSGSGKSSVVKAGLLPRLRNGTLAGSENWFVVEMYPSNRPFDELEVALIRTAVNPVSSLKEQLERDEHGLTRALNIILPSDDSQLVLVIDQFEELFTLVESEEQRQLFINSLLTTIKNPRSRLRVIVTLRADFYDKPLQYHDFGELLRQQTEIVLPLSSDELEQAIRQPTENAGARFESGLMNAIVTEVSDQLGMLPLLQYALTQLFDQRQGRTLTLNAYQQLGGVTGALAGQADDIFEQLSNSQQQSTRQLFLRVVTLGEGTEDTRRRVQQTELEAIPEIDAILDRFGQARLLTFDRDPATRIPTVEVAHEALIRSWDRFKEWVNDSRDELRIQRNLTIATNEWLDNKRDSGFLARDARLEQFEGWAEQTEFVLSADEQAFLSQSLQVNEEREQAEITRKAHETKISQRAQNFQRATAGLVIVVVLAVVAIVVAIMQSGEAQSQLGMATIAQGKALNAQQTAVAQKGEAITQVFIAGETLTPIPVTLDAVATKIDEVYRSQFVGQASSSQQDNENDAMAYAFEAIGNAKPPIDAQSIFYDIAGNSHNSATLTGHLDKVNSVAFSPDGTIFASASNDQTIKLWNAETAQLLSTLSGHEFSVSHVAFSPDGKTLASASWDETIKLWDVETAQELATFSGHESWVNSVAFSPDGSTLASASNDNTIKLWDVETAQLLSTFTGHSDWVNSVAFSPDGSILASASDDHTIKLWDVKTTQLLTDGDQSLATLSGHSGRIRSIAFSPDGMTLASASDDQIIKLWDIGTAQLLSTDGRSLATLTGHSEGIKSVTFSPDGTTLASASDDNTIKLWDVGTAQLLSTFTGHESWVLSVAFSPDGTTLASASDDMTIKLWDARTAQLLTTNDQSLATLRGHEDAVRSIAFSPDGMTLASASCGKRSGFGFGSYCIEGEIKLRDVEIAQELATLSKHEGVIWSLAFYGNTLAFPSVEHTIKLWDVETDQELYTLNGHFNFIGSVAFSPDGNTLASASWDQTIKLWDVETAQELATLNGHSNRVNSVAFSSDGNTLASGSEDSTIKLWDVDTTKLLFTLTGHESSVMGVAFSPDGNTLASTSWDKTIKLWDVETAQLLTTLTGHENAVLSVAFNPDGTILASGGADQTVKLWDVETAQPLTTLTGHKETIWSIAFSPNGTTLASASADHTIKLWNISSLPLMRQWVQENRYVREFTCEERARFNSPVQCDVEGNFPTRTPYPTPSPIFVPTLDFTPFYKNPTWIAEDEVTNTAWALTITPTATATP